jgi:DNA-binding response OmpR family regulator
VADAAGKSAVVLLVDDDARIRRTVGAGLRLEGFEVVPASGGRAALAAIEQIEPAVMLLDMAMPDLDGLEVLRRLRGAGHDLPVCVLSARDEIGDRVAGLEAGADDYVVKPFAFSELLSRVRAVVRRGRPERPVVLRCGPLALDPATRTTCVDGTDVSLSPREFAMLEMLLDRRGAVVTRTELLDHVWDSSYDGVSNVVDVYVRSLRDKIDRRFGVHLIHTVRGAGYRITDSP